MTISLHKLNKDNSKNLLDIFNNEDFKNYEYIIKLINECAGIEVDVLHTPGHTVGGCCYYLPKEHRLFSGDTLFCASIGRTDLPTGSSSQLVRSVQEKIMILPDDTKIYPGHMEETSVQFEKEQKRRYHYRIF